MTTDHRVAAERLLANADEWAAQAGVLSPRASERACLAHAQVHALLAIHDTLTAADPTPTNPLTATHPWPPWPSTLPDVDAVDRYAANEAKQREAGDADGTPSVTASAADDPAGDAVDGEEGERRYLNAQTAIVGRWAGKCLHVWAEDTCVGETTRHFICTECGTTRTEDRQ